MPPLTSDELEWIKATGDAMRVIRLVTQGEVDCTQLAAIHALADTLHNIGMIGTDNSMLATLHSAERLSLVKDMTSRLLESVHWPKSERRSLVQGLLRWQRLTTNRSDRPKTPNPNLAE